MTTYLTLSDSLFDLLHLDLTEAFDLGKRLSCSCMNRLMALESIADAPSNSQGADSHCNGIVAIGFELCDVCCSDAWGQ